MFKMLTMNPLRKHMNKGLLQYIKHPYEHKINSTPCYRSVHHLYKRTFCVNSGNQPRYVRSLTEEQWRQRLTPQQFEITRQKGTEMAFTGEYYNHYEKGTYHCVCCKSPLFNSSTKFDSGSGWPSFSDVEKSGDNESSVASHVDRSYGMGRIEVTCAECSAHLGHVFEDGPEPTGLRYCINSAAIQFQGDTEPGNSSS